VRLVVEHDQVSVADVEARQMLTGILGIKDVLVDNKGSASSVGCTSTVRREKKSKVITSS
jgi:hypothetical protein